MTVTQGAVEVFSPAEISTARLRCWGGNAAVGAVRMGFWGGGLGGGDLGCEGGGVGVEIGGRGVLGGQARGIWG